jgi:hypothetical protein
MTDCRRNAEIMVKTTIQEWLLIFYSVPSKPVSNRMMIWRKLAKTGAVQLKGAVYILPATDEHEEFLQWLLGEVKSMGGDGAFVKSNEIKTMENTDIRELFLRQADEEYRDFEKNIDALERKIQSVRKGTRVEEGRGLADQFSKLSREMGELRRRDFFSSPLGEVLRKRMQILESSLKGMGKAAAEIPAAIELKRAEEYQGRAWITRKKPFIDRMASAWLIRRFIDEKAVFKFIDERQLGSMDRNAATFDIRGGEFTHVGDLCTFEVLVKSFGIRDKAVRKIAEIVHDLDVKDDKYQNAETAGTEDILIGIRKTSKTDADALERGMMVFEMMYQSRT